MGAFFVDRPVFAWVIAIVMSLVGAIAVVQLPVSQYPDIAPTSVRISAPYPGATAQTVETTVTRVIEDQLTGLEGLLYTTAVSRPGSSETTLTFDSSIAPVTAQNDVQVRVTQIESQLPEVVRDLGVTVTRSNSSFLMVGSIVSEDGTHTSTDLGDVYLDLVESPLLRLDGVGDARLFGSGYAMRVWLDPLALARYQLTPNDVIAAVRAQNASVAVGSMAAPPLVEGTQFTASITAQSQLETEEDFRRILLKTTEYGGAVFLSDVARVEIGNESYDRQSRLDRKPAAGFGVNLRTGANAVETSAAVRDLMEELESSLPEGMTFEVPYDTAPFVELSIEQVYKTLIEAILLVLVVLMIFLQTWRATIIPIITVPVALLGAFAVLSLLGYSINTLTMFAMVLAIGLLVDDAIVVVENTERLMEEEDLGAVEATRRSMTQIQSALIGILVVLAAVFLPMAFSAGSVGVIYRQFSVTIISAMVLSLGIALSLTPAMCAGLLRKRGEVKFAPARWFNSGLKGLVSGFAAAVAATLKMRTVMVLLLAGIIGGGLWIYDRLPTSFIPREDQGVVLSLISLPTGTTIPITDAVLSEVEAYFLEDEADVVDGTFGVRGFSFQGQGQNYAIVFTRLIDFEQRTTPAQSAGAVAQRANQRFFGHRTAQIFTIQPPAIQGLGNTGGFSMYLLDRARNGTEALIEAANSLVGAARQDDRLTSVRADGTEFETALNLEIDRTKAESFGVSVDQVNAMLSVIFAGRDVNDFLLQGGLRPVVVQGDAPYRMSPDDVQGWYARNAGDEMVPFSAFMQTRWDQVPPTLNRFDGVSAVPISGDAAQGASSGVAMSAMMELTEDTLPGYGVGWSGISYQERAAGSNVLMLYAISALVVFLALAALYESWVVPLAVMLSVPVGMAGALAFSYFLGQANDVYFTVGLLTTIGLAARNAILVVEFAEERLRATGDLVQSAVTAARQRLRPILMTALTFMLGVVPLALASGPGAQAQNAIGIVVLGGMTASTVVGVFFVPVLYVVVRSLFSRGRKDKTPG
ncbi:efflux RND transporter permease subunit [Roseovarius aestuariivivens]|uniref:efflux RND transporter permease subunit n=1 Tax=Roseovarius aestuariivivens TaxID=1888910 RepID=UPI00108183C0|nr:efflux RND transporter permease subunit [Roseovarius aestuariivivens]